MIPFSIVVPDDTPNKTLYRWLFKTAILALNLKHVVVKENADPAFESLNLPAHFLRSQLSSFDQRTFDHGRIRFNAQGIILNGEAEDLLFTAFYLINCLQEPASEAYDELGRFKYKGSYQEKFNCVEKNKVTEIFEQYFAAIFPHALRNQVKEKSVFFFSHDIDSLYGALLQDGKAALRGGRFDVISRLIVNTLFMHPDWFNIDAILKIDSEYDLRSTFFWIVNKGRVNPMSTNADYNIRSKKIQSSLKNIREKGHHLGLHKSISSESFTEERTKLNFPVIINRNHYLKFRLPEHFDSLEASPMKIDCSLGYAERYGFRNSLAIPFVPINLKERAPYHFMEVPLNVMDGTFQKYMEVPAKDVSGKIISFIEDNKYNSVLSVLWHNHFFGSYRFRGYFEPYLELLDYLKTEKHRAIGPDQMYKHFYFAT